MNKKFWLKKIVGCMVAAAAIIALLGFVVMSLWNHILVEVLNVRIINFWQATGILVLCKILFGGIKGGWGGKRHRLKEEMREKLQHMTPEEREKLKQEWRDRCRMWGRNKENSAGAE